MTIGIGRRVVNVVRSHPRIRRVLLVGAVVGVNVAAVVIPYRSVVFQQHTLMMGAYMAGSEGVNAPWNYPDDVPGVRSVDGGDIFVIDQEPVFDPAANAFLQEPQIRKAHNMIAEGHLPLWTANVGTGMPLAANGQSGAANPLQWPLLVQPHPFEYDAWVLARLLLGGLLMTAFVIYLGIRPLAASVAGVVFMLSGQFVTHVTNGEMSVEVLLPLVLLGAEMCARRPGRRAVGVLGLGIGLNILGGYPEETLYCLIMAAAYAVVRLGVIAWSGRSTRSILPAASAMLAGSALGVFLAMPLLVPFFEFVRNAYNIHAPGVNDGTLIDPRGQVTMLVAPHLTDFQAPQWFGVTASILALLGIRSRLLPRGVATFMTVAGVVSTLKIYGIPDALNAAIGNLPIIEQTFYRRYAGVIGSASVAVMAAAGLQRLVSRDRRMSIWEPVGAALLVSALFAANSRTFHDEIQVHLHHLTVIVVTATLIVGVAAVAAAAPRLSPRSATIWAVVAGTACVVELVVLASPMLPFPRRSDPLQATPTTQYLDRVAPTGHGRIVGTGAILYPDQPDAYNFDSIQVIDALFPERYIAYVRHFIDPTFGDRLTWDQPSTQMSIYANPFVDALDVQYLVAYEELRPDRLRPAPQDQFTHVARNADGLNVYRNLHAISRANVYFDVVPSASEQQTIATMTQSGFDPRRSAVIETSDPLPHNDAPPMPATFASYEDQRVEIRTDAPKDGILVLSDAWFPGWTATVDGAQSDILPANLQGRGVRVPAGSHTVVMTYAPRSTALGLVLAGVGIGGFIVGGWGLPALRRRFRPSGNGPLDSA